MDEDWEAMLEGMGWTVECHSPFEIRHEDGSFASGQAAQMVLEYLKDNPDYYDEDAVCKG